MRVRFVRSVRPVLAGVLVLAACGGGGGFPDAKVTDDSNDPAPGTFKLDWTLTDTANNPIDCTRVSAVVVTANVTSKQVLGGSTQVFSCGPGMGTSQGLAPGVYDITFELGGGQGLITTAPRQANIEIKSGESVTLAPIVFAIEATGGLRLHLTTNKVGGNCGLIAAGGAGLTGTSITLEHAPETTCEPVTLQIAAGATTTASTYTVNCAAPTVGPCIENDQEITTMADIPSGGYQLHIRGTIAAAECWKNDDLIAVPPIGNDLVRTLNLGLATGTPGC